MRYNPDEDYKVIETELLVKNISGERKTAVMGQLCSVNGIMQKMIFALDDELLLYKAFTAGGKD